jgi:hypothetical protein
MVVMSKITKKVSVTKNSESFTIPKSKPTGSAKVSGIPMSGIRPITSQNSTRNSVERAINGAVSNLISAS